MLGQCKYGMKEFGFAPAARRQRSWGVVLVCSHFFLNGDCSKEFAGWDTITGCAIKSIKHDAE